MPYPPDILGSHLLRKCLGVAAVVAIVGLFAVVNAGAQSERHVASDAVMSAEARSPAATTQTAHAAPLVFTCRVQCPAAAQAPFSVSCQQVTYSACQQVAAQNANCRADYMPESWCRSRSLN